MAAAAAARVAGEEDETERGIDNGGRPAAAADSEDEDGVVEVGVSFLFLFRDQKDIFRFLS